MDNILVAMDRKKFLEPDPDALAQVLDSILKVDPSTPEGPARFLAERLLARGYRELPPQMNVFQLFNQIFGFRVAWNILQRQAAVPPEELIYVGPLAGKKRFLVFSAPQIIQMAIWAYTGGHFKSLIPEPHYSKALTQKEKHAKTQRRSSRTRRITS
jgi:hypothetical protein